MNLNNKLQKRMKCVHSIIKNVFLLSLFLGSYSTAQANTLPDLGSPDLVEYDTQTEQELGRAFTNALHTQYKLYNDLDTNDYIRNLGHKLASYTGNNRHYSFYVIDDNNINAFAGPNGVIGIHTGLIEACQTEDELAAVIAHEISHVTQNHLSRRYEYSTSQGSLNTIATLIAAILIGTQDPSAGMATLMGGMGYNLQQQLKNSRQHESEADAIGIQLLYKTGYNPHAMGDFFARLSKESQLDSIKVPEILRTHPVSEHRLAEAENRAQNLPQKKEIKPYSFLKLIQSRIISNKYSQDSYQENTLNGLNSEQSCYIKTLEQIKNKKMPPKCIDSLAFNTQSNPIYISTLIQGLIKLKGIPNPETYKKIKKIIDLKIELYPKSESLPIYYSRLLRKDNLNSQAGKVLETAEQHLNYKYNLLIELSEQKAKEGKNGEAYLNLAKAYLESGNVERSQYFLKLAEETKTNNDDNLEQAILLFKEQNSKLLNNKDKTKEN